MDDLGTAGAPSSTPAHRLGPPVLAFAVAVLLAAGGVFHGFTGDDLALVKKNPSIEPGRGLFSLFEESYWGPYSDAGLYRPLTVLSFAVNRRLTGPGPAGFHLVNVLLHGLCAALVTSLAAAVGLRRGASLLAGLLVAVHPLHTEAVQSIVGRAELLAALLGLAAVRVHLVRRARGQWGQTVLCGLLFLGGLLSKESAVGIAGVVLVAEILGHSGRVRGLRIARASFGFLVPLAVYLVVRARVLGGVLVPEGHTYFELAGAQGPERILTSIAAFGRGLGLVLFPIRLSADYSLGSLPLVSSVTDPSFLRASLLILALGGGLLAAYRGGLFRVALGGLFFVAVLLPVSNLLVPIGVVMAERLLYLPLIGLEVMAAAVVSEAGVGRLRRAGTALLVMVLLLLSTRTALRLGDWKDNETVQRSILRAYPQNSYANYNLGVIHYVRGERAEARLRFEQALRVRPGYERARYYQALLLAEEGKIDEALVRLVPLLSDEDPDRTIRPVIGRGFHLKGSLLLRKGSEQAAALALYRATVLLPDDSTVWLDRGRVLLRLGERAEAAVCLRKAVQVASDAEAAKQARALLSDLE